MMITPSFSIEIKRVKQPALRQEKSFISLLKVKWYFLFLYFRKITIVQLYRSISLFFCI